MFEHFHICFWRLQKSACIRRIKFILGAVLSPTRRAIDLWKQSGAEKLDKRHRKRLRGNRLRDWSLLLFILELTVCVAFSIALDQPMRRWWGLLPLYYSFSRVNEIAYAFYNDSLSRSRDSNLKFYERIRMAMRSMFGLIFNFAVLFYFLPICCPFHEEFKSFFDAVYLSGVTVATLGYGDNYPVRFLSRLLALYEVFSGILLVAVAIATYVGSRDEAQPRRGN